jgi:hypothetical protein
MQQASDNVYAGTTFQGCNSSYVVTEEPGMGRMIKTLRDSGKLGTV